MYRGAKSTLQAVAVSNFIYFYTFHGLKRLLGAQGKQTATTDLTFACVAGERDPRKKRSSYVQLTVRTCSTYSDT